MWDQPRVRRPRLKGDFWEYVDKSAGPDCCWLWTGYCDRDGYGRYRGDEAHRFAWELENGPTDLYVLHHCDCRPCVNLDHLHLGTQAQNILEAVERRRMASGTRAGNYKHGLYVGRSRARKARKAIALAAQMAVAS